MVNPYFFISATVAVYKRPNLPSPLRLKVAKSHYNPK